MKPGSIRNETPAHRPGRGSPDPSRPGLAQRTIRFISFIEQLPYGASLMQEKRVSRGSLGTGILVMAVGASIFALGWWEKWAWLVETAFFITLVGWMMVILDFAFAVVGWAAHQLSPKRRKRG